MNTGFPNPQRDLSIHPSLYLSIYLSIHLSIYPHLFLLTDSGSLAERKQVEALQEQAQLMLTEHVQLVHPRQVVRVGRLLLLPAKLHAIPSAIVERTFFRGLVGAASIPKLIGNILHSDIV